jgi:tetratricopeptide (TPR) repeat protein
MHERDTDRQRRQLHRWAGDAVRLPSVSLLVVLGLASAGCAWFSFPEEPPAEPVAVDPMAEPEEPAALAAAREVEASQQSWSSLAATGRDALKMGDFEAAEEAYLEAVAITAELDPDDIRSRTALSNLVRLAAQYQRHRRFEDAGRIVSRVVAESLNGRHPDFEVAAPVLITQGHYLERAGRRSETIRIFEAGLASAPRSSLGSQERMVMQRGLALAYIEEGRPADAAPLLEDLRVRTSRIGDGKTIAYAAVLSDIGDLREAEGDIAGADASFEEAIALYRELEPDSAQLANTLNRVAWFKTKNDNAKEAVPLAQEGLAILDLHGIGGPTRAAYLDTLATAQTGIGHYTQAEHNYKQAVEERGQGNAASQLQQAGIVENYIALLRKVGKNDRAEGLERQLAAERATAEANASEGSALEEVEAPAVDTTTAVAEAAVADEASAADEAPAVSEASAASETPTASEALATSEAPATGEALAGDEPSADQAAPPVHAPSPWDQPPGTAD